MNFFNNISNNSEFKQHFVLQFCQFCTLTRTSYHLLFLLSE